MAKTILRFSNRHVNICNLRVAFETDMLLFTITVHKVDEMMRMVYRFMILTMISGLWFQKWINQEIIMQCLLLILMMFAFKVLYSKILKLLYGKLFVHTGCPEKVTFKLIFEFLSFVGVYLGVENRVAYTYVNIKYFDF